MLRLGVFSRKRGYITNLENIGFVELWRSALNVVRLPNNSSSVIALQR